MLAQFPGEGPLLTAPFPATAIAPTPPTASSPANSSPIPLFIQTPEKPSTTSYTRYSVANREGERSLRATSGRPLAARLSNANRMPRMAPRNTSSRWLTCLQELRWDC